MTATATGTTTDTTATAASTTGDELERTLVAIATSCGPQLRAHAVRHDRERSWVADSFEAVRDAGLLRAAVPVELGGAGATIRQIAMVQRELARHCGSTALATAMHQHVTAFTAWRHRRGLPGAEATLRRVAADGIVLVSTGGGDATHPRGQAVKVDGGYRVTGSKAFSSQAPVGTVLSTMFAYDDPERGRRVLNVSVPFAEAGVTISEDWDTLGMRGTASHTVNLRDVFVPDERVLADRPHGEIDGPLQVIFSIGFSIIAAVYLGVAEGALQHAIDGVGDRVDDPTVQRQVGLARHRAQVASWALDGALAAVGEDPAPSADLLVDVMTAKREIALAGVEICDLALEIGGGRAFYSGSPIERAYRDVRAAKLHPFDPETTLRLAGRLALGLPVQRS